MSKKTFRGFIALLIVLVLGAIVIACGIGSQDVNGKWFKNPNVLTWFDNWGKGQEKPDDDTEKDNISLASYALETADFAAYGISPQALEAKVITVDFEPANTTNKRIGWVCKWKDATSTWASGKNINDYVDFVPAADFGASATLAVKQPFGEPVVVTATSRANSALTSSSQFEYVARYSQLWGDSDLTLDFGDNIDVFENLYTDDCYTVLPDSCFADVTLELNTELYQYLLSKSCDINDKLEFCELPGFISWQQIMSELNDFDYAIVAKWFDETGGDTVFCIRVTMTCSYTDGFGGVVTYTWTDSEPVYLSDNCIAEMSTPPTNITVNPGGGAF